MPTEKKREQVQELEKKIGSCTIAIATDYRGLTGEAMTELRRYLRQKGIEYKVVKNTLAQIAAKSVGREGFQGILEGPTGVAFGYGDPVALAKALEEYVRTNRLPLVVKKGMLDGQVLEPAQVAALATMPPKAELAARLVGQLSGPLYGLVNVLSSPLRGLATVLQRRVEQQQST